MQCTGVEASNEPNGGCHGAVESRESYLGQHNGIGDDMGGSSVETYEYGVEGTGEGEDEFEDEDEAMDSSDDEGYNLAHFGISQALPVPDGPPDLDAGPPQTAEEYLRWVRFEASRCPRIMRKDVDPAVLERQQRGDEEAPEPGGSSPSPGSGRRRGGGGTFAAQVPPPVTSHCPEWARPSPKWLSAFLQDFHRLRRALGAMQRQHVQELSATQLPALGNTAAWDRLCFDQWQPLEQEQREQGPQSEQPGSVSGAAGGEQEPDPGPATPPPPPPPPSPPSSPPPAAADTCGPGSMSGSSGGTAAHGRHQQQQQQQQRRRREGTAGARPGGDGGGGGGGTAGSSGGGAETDRLCGPVVRTVLCLDQVSVGFLIQRHVAQLNAQPCLSYIRSQWLFALAAVLERPVPPDVAAAMRDLVRRCSAWRAALERPDDPALPRLNVLLAVAGGYFGQDEHLSAAAAAACLGDLA